MECEKGNVEQTTYTYDKNDRLLTESIGDDTVTYTYDDNGNMLEKSEGTEQTFDLLGRMSSYKSAEGTVTTYGYYADDMRKSKKTGNSAEITQIWSDDDIALELENDEVKSTYVYGENLICSIYGWYLYNTHGDVTALTANNGTVTKNYEYNSFGVQKSATDDGDENPYRYSGEYYDAESGYTYLQARYYDPDTGRFISEDPAMDGDNWYVYCGNDPVNMVDPTGMSYLNLPYYEVTCKNKRLNFKKKCAHFWLNQTFSEKGKKLLKDYEKPPESSYVYNKKNKVIGYKPYNVGDGGITYGYGSYVASDDQDKAKIVNKYMTKGYITIKNAEKLLNYEIGLCERAINDYIKTARNKKGKKIYIALKQQEFDALIIERFLNGHLNDPTLNLLKKKKRKRKKLMKALMSDKTNPDYKKGWEIRAKNICNVFFDGNYKRIYK